MMYINIFTYKKKKTYNARYVSLFYGPKNVFWSYIAAASLDCTIIQQTNS